MIFTAAQVRKVLEGRKTEYRRLVVNDAPRTKVKRGKTEVIKPFRPTGGRSLPVKKWAKDEETGKRRCLTSCRVRVTNVEQELLGGITFDGARAEGFRTRDEFKMNWVATRDREWLDARIILFERLGDGVPWPDLIRGHVLAAMGVTETGLLRRLRMLERAEAVTVTDGVWSVTADAERLAALARFNEAHAHRLVWVLAFELDPMEQPRLLTEHRGGELRGDYTTSPAQALRGEFAAISEQDWKDHVQARADMTADQWRALEQQTRDRDRALLSLEDRMIAVRRETRDPSKEAVIRSELRALERMRRSGQSTVAQLKQVTQIEAKLDSAAGFHRAA